MYQISSARTGPRATSLVLVFRSLRRYPPLSICSYIGTPGGQACPPPARFLASAYLLVLYPLHDFPDPWHLFPDIAYLRPDSLLLSLSVALGLQTWDHGRLHRTNVCLRNRALSLFFHLVFCSFLRKSEAPLLWTSQNLPRLPVMIAVVLRDCPPTRRGYSRGTGSPKLGIF